MKTIITALLCASLMLVPINAAPPEQNPSQGLSLAVFVLACGVACGIFVIWVYAKQGSGTHLIVLQRDHYDGAWVDMQTNIVTLAGFTNSIAVFADYMTDQTARYRVRDLGIVK